MRRPKRKDDLEMEFRECINFLLTTAQHSVFQLMSARLAEHDITPGQYGVLNHLWSNGPSAPKEIAKSLCLETTTISGVLDRMQKKGLIDRYIDPQDRRSVQVVMTEKGALLKAPVLSIVEEVNREVLSVFSPEARQQLKESLRVIGGLEDGPADPAQGDPANPARNDTADPAQDAPADPAASPLAAAP